MQRRTGNNQRVTGGVFFTNVLVFRVSATTEQRDAFVNTSGTQSRFSAMGFGYILSKCRLKRTAWWIDSGEFNAVRYNETTIAPQVEVFFKCSSLITSPRVPCTTSPHRTEHVRYVKTCTRERFANVLTARVDSQVPGQRFCVRYKRVRQDMLIFNIVDAFLARRDYNTLLFRRNLNDVRTMFCREK